MPVYNIVESETCITWDDALVIGNKMLFKYPFSRMMWMPFGKNHRTMFSYKLHFLLLHYIPAILIDFILILLRKKPV